MPTEPPNEQLRVWLLGLPGLASGYDAHVHDALSGIERTIRALLTTREELERTREAEAFAHQSVIEYAERRITEALESHGRLMQERDSKQCELEALRAENSRLQEEFADLCRIAVHFTGWQKGDLYADRITDAVATARKALNATPKWLAEKLSEAEKRGYKEAGDG